MSRAGRDLGSMSATSWAGEPGMVRDGQGRAESCQQLDEATV